MLRVWLTAGREPDTFWRLSLCQVIYTLESLSGGRRRGPGGKVYRKGTASDLIGMFGGYDNVRKVVEPPVTTEGAAVP